MPEFPIDRFRQEQTPFYYYDLTLLRRTLSALKEAAHEPNYHVHYAIKANSNPGLLPVIAAAGLGADCVSGGEIRAALEAGFPAEKIVFAGVGKGDREIILALDAGIACFNAESIEELNVIADLAAGCGKKANVALRINPNIDAHTHHYITTGLHENKFGIPMEMADDAARFCVSSPWLNLTGLHFHIGSQITDMQPFERLCHRINAIMEHFSEIGISLTSINVGGGLGIDYNDPDRNPIPDFKGYFNTFRRYLKLTPEQSLHFELGRAIVGQCGSLITEVRYVKHGFSKNFVITDAGMTDLIRPALYNAYHKIENLTSPKPDELHTYDVVGPVCESADCFGTDQRLPLTERGNLLALRSAGAYGEIMASGYNCRPLPSSLLL